MRLDCSRFRGARCLPPKAARPGTVLLIYDSVQNAFSQPTALNWIDQRASNTSLALF
jgi:hypothetical protein